ncbi:MAG TPA: hypothetical protein VGL81_21365 [Polyangiaceae bacterium]|jgi:hypothetical protein
MLSPQVLRADALGRPSPVTPLLDEHLAVRCPGALSEERCAEYAGAVLAARQAWTRNFEGKQFTLGRAYYTHLEEDREDEYFAGAAASDATVRRILPGLQEHMLAAASALVGAPVRPRVGWCGPGVHVFPANGEVARRGGEVHFDTEGLRPPQLERRIPAVTLVLMLQRPALGGGLRVWGATYEGDDFPRKPDPRVEVTQIAYEVGELVVIDSYRLHQILPFRGDTDRISATMHACLDAGSWEAWF